MAPVDSRPRPAFRSAAAAVAVTALATVALVLALLLVDMRAGLAPAGDRASARADALVAQLDGASAAEARVALRAAGGPARIVDEGDVVAEAGPAAVWTAGTGGLPARLASLGAGWDVRAGAVEVSRALPGGNRLIVRGRVAESATSLTPAIWVGLAGALVLALLAGLAVGLRTHRRRRAIAALAASLAVAPGRAGNDVADLPGDLSSLGAAVAVVRERLRSHDEAVEAGVEILAAVLTPMAFPVASRTSGGRVLRNDALLGMLNEMGPRDGADLEAALDRTLSASGPTSQRLVLGDSRVLTVEAWAVPAGRVAVVADRSEQERLAALRRRISVGAARRLRAPIEELQSLAQELQGVVPAAHATMAARLLATADRLGGMTRSMVRGSDHDLASPGGAERIGAAGLLWGLARGDEDRLRSAGLRIEIEVAADAPAIWAELDRLQEVMAALIANAERFTPRGGTITLWAAQAPSGRAAIGVRDTGPGVGAAELRAVFEPFVRGSDAMAHPGDGLGLFGAQALTERLGGRLTIEPGRAGGARLELPAAPVDRAQDVLAA